MKTRAHRNIEWIEAHCKVPEGKHVGKPVKLREWQREELRKIYDNKAGTRRAILSFGRKNGKTALSAFLLLLHLVGPEAQPNSQLYSAAQSRDQAAILFALAAKCVRLSQALSEFITIRDTAKELFCEELGTKYKALSAEASTAYGLSPVFIVHDELGQVRGPRSELYEALETATGAQDNPLSIVISTQAPNPTDLLSVLIDDAETGADPRTVLSLYSAPDDADAFCEESIKLANPAYGDFQNAKETLAMAKDAERMPSREPEYRNLILNQRVEMHAPFINRTVWGGCFGEVKPIDGEVIYAGLDLSEVNDLTALVYITKHDNLWHVNPKFWLPGDGLKAKARNDRQVYDIWAKEGLLLTTPGPTVSYEFLAETLYQDCQTHNIKKIGFDRYNWKHLKPWLIKAGFSDEEVEGDEALFEGVGQGYLTMSPALRDLEDMILNKRLVHAHHPVMDMCCVNAIVERDAAGNRKLRKTTARGGQKLRIDGMVALAMATSIAMTYEEGGAENASPWDENPEYRLVL